MKMTSSKIVLVAVTGLTLVAVASGLGSFVGQRLASQSDNRTELAQEPVVLKADTAARGKAMSMATGFIDRNRTVEGLFVLDHLSGLLQCWVVNPRNGQIAGVYSANVNDHLEIAKGGEIDYVMTTGNFEIDGRQGNDSPADCICYVGDGGSGRVVGYSLFYDRQLIPQNRQQQGELVVVARGQTREGGLKRE